MTDTPQAAARREAAFRIIEETQHRTLGPGIGGDDDASRWRAACFKIVKLFDAHASQQHAERSEDYDNLVRDAMLWRKQQLTDAERSEIADELESDAHERERYFDGRETAKDKRSVELSRIAAAALRSTPKPQREVTDA